MRRMGFMGRLMSCGGRWYLRAILASGDTHLRATRFGGQARLLCCLGRGDGAGEFGVWGHPACGLRMSPWVDRCVGVRGFSV
jgi:hypothetical protein